jgi:pimeloyl-ACP methyl ester carboxylesterase
MQSKTFQTDDLVFEYLEWEAPENAETVVLLHGFPQIASSTWAKTAELLNARGYRVVAPLQRGYSPAAMPSEVRRYALESLADDIIALLEELEVDRVHLVGHDWGGAVSWVLAATRPEVLSSLTVVSMPHPAALPRALLTTLQGFKSWYILAFQFPWLIKQLLQHGKQFTYRWLQSTGLPESLSRAYIDRLTISDKTLDGALNWYRAFPYNASYVAKLPYITTSTVFIWSTADIAVNGRAARLSQRYVKGSYKYIQLADVPHWIPETVPEKLAEIILEHLAKSSNL